MSRPTPGPWTSYPPHRYFAFEHGDHMVAVRETAKPHRFICNVTAARSVLGDVLPEERRIEGDALRANARLIAAAPDLAEALGWIAEEARRAGLDGIRARAEAALRIAGTKPTNAPEGT